MVSPANLDIPFTFGCYDDDSAPTESIEYLFSQLDTEEESSWGATKFVIFPENKNIVIKIPFNGFYKYDSEEQEEYFDPFFLSDYCAKEAAIYKKAERKGIKKLFAKTKYGGMTSNNETPFYISERVFCYENFYEEENFKDKKPSKESFEKAKKNSINGLPSRWLAIAYEYYGDTIVKKLLDFIAEEDINDLHDGNVGFRKNGAPVIFDYSGYSE